jgi:hypothetical protein
MSLLTDCYADMSGPESPRQALRQSAARLFRGKTVLPARFASVAVAELWHLVVERRMKDKPLLTS